MRVRPLRPPSGRALARVLLLVLGALVLGACELRAELNVSVEDDGSGAVEVAVGLDE